MSGMIEINISEMALFPPEPFLKERSASGGSAGASCARTVAPVPPMPPGVSVGAREPPSFTVMRPASVSSCLGGGLKSLGL